MKALNVPVDSQSHSLALAGSDALDSNPDDSFASGKRPRGIGGETYIPNYSCGRLSWNPRFHDEVLPSERWSDGISNSERSK